jgi:hypothetical protein
MTDIDIENYPLDGDSILLDDQIICYVEGMEDEHFWKDIFSSFAPELNIRFFSYSRENNLKSGKQTVLSEHNIENACDNLILCVDSDLEYLLKNEPLSSHPYIFHTYTYSIENHKISPEALARIVEKSSYPDANIFTFSFIKFIKDYSKASYPLLPYILYFEKKKLEQSISEPLLSKKNLK